MAAHIINLDLQYAPYYVSPDQFSLLVARGDTVQFKAVDGEFTVSFVNADQFFNNVSSRINIKINSADSTKILSSVYTSKSALLLLTEQLYSVIDIINKNPGYAPPKIIIVA